jgi:hypothetical protein
MYYRLLKKGRHTESVSGIRTTRLCLNIIEDQLSSDIEANSLHHQYSHYVEFEVFTAVVMKSIIFWDMTPCSLLSGTRRFGGTYRSK